MAVSRVGGTAVAAATAATTQSITVPSTTQGGDLILLAQNVNPSTGTTTTPSGYALVLSYDYSTSTRLYLWSKTAAGTIGAASSDASTSVTMTNTASQRTAAVVEVYRGWGSIINATGKAETTAVTSHTAASATTAVSSLPLMFGCERAPTTPSTTVTQQSGWTRWNNAWGTGSGAAGIFAGDGATVNAAGTIGGGNWVCDQANVNFVTIVLGLTATSGPNISAGSDQTVASGSLVTLTGVETSVGTVTARGWSQVSGPTVTLSSTTTQTATFTASTADVYTFSYSVTDETGTTTDTMLVAATTTSPTPTAVISAGSWTVSGAATIPAALSDASDLTFAVSSSSPSNDVLEVRLAPIAASALAAGMTAFYNLYASNSAQTVTVAVELRQGASTSIAGPWNETLGTTVTPLTHPITSTALAAVTDATDVRLRFTANAS